MSGCEEEASAIQYGIDKYKKELSNWILENECIQYTCNVDGLFCENCVIGEILEFMGKEVYEDENGERHIRNKI